MLLPSARALPAPHSTPSALLQPPDTTTATEHLVHSLSDTGSIDTDTNQDYTSHESLHHMTESLPRSQSPEF